MRSSNLMAAIGVMLFTSTVIAGNWNVPTDAKALKNPLVRDARLDAEAKQIYAEYCVECHGAKAAGDGSRDKVEYDLRDIVGDLNDGELYWKITHGVGRMPSYAGPLTDRQRWLMVNHLRVLHLERETARAPGGR